MSANIMPMNLAVCQENAEAHGMFINSTVGTVRLLAHLRLLRSHLLAAVDTGRVSG
jgi:hypothetical protein